MLTGRLEAEAASKVHSLWFCSMRFLLGTHACENSIKKQNLVWQRITNMNFDRLMNAAVVSAQSNGNMYTTENCRTKKNNSESYRNENPKTKSFDEKCRTGKLGTKITSYIT